MKSCIKCIYSSLNCCTKQVMFFPENFLVLLITLYIVNGENKNSDTFKITKVRKLENNKYKEDEILRVEVQVMEHIKIPEGKQLIDYEIREMGVNQLNKLRIEDIYPTAFEELKNFHVIDLSDNELTIIRNEVFTKMKDLKSLHLNNNKISTIEENAFDNMPNITSINLMNNKITKLNGNWFKNSPKLRIINFIGNQIKEFEADSFKNLRGGHMLNGRQIGIELYFSNNKIDKIHPYTFKGIPIIRSLQLKENALKELPEKLFQEIIVEDIDLALNNITCTPKEIFDATLRYQSNPVLCA